MRRWAFRGAIAAALLLVAYAAAGYWLAPRLVLRALESRAAQFGAALTVDEIRTDPFALAVDLVGVQLLGPRQARLAAAESIHVDMVWASLWGDAWTVERAEVRSPHVELAFGPKGSVNWPVPAPRPESAHADEAVPAGTPLLVRSLAVTDGILHVVDHSRGVPAEARLDQLTLEMRGLTTLPDGAADYELAAQVAAGGTLSSRGSLSLEPLAAQGKLGLAAVPLSKLWQLAAPGTDSAKAEVHAQAAYALQNGKFVLRELSFEAAGPAYAGIELERLTIEAAQLALPPKGSFKASARAELAGGASAAANGSVDIAARRAELELQVKAVPLPLAQPFLPQSVAVKIPSGTVSGEGTVAVDAAGNGPAAVYEGTLAVHELRLEERDSGNLLLAWPAARSEEARLRFAPYGVELGVIDVEKPEGRLIIEPGGNVNFAAAFQDGERKEQRGQRGRFHAAFERLRISEGRLHFADRSLDNPFEVTIVGLAGSVTGFTTAPAEAARVRLNGRVQPYGTARIRGTINLNAPTSLADITANFRNLRLEDFNPYVAKFAGYRIRSGRVSAQLHYEVQEGRLVGENQLVFEKMQLGEKVQSAGALDLPLDLAVALLADSRGRINLDIPVSGNLNDPKFDLGAIVAKAFGNVLRKIVTAPFRVLAGILGGRQGDLGEVRFEAGMATLTPPAEEDVAQVAKALEARPRLGVRVSGGYDPQRDLEALRLRTVRREIAQRVGIDGLKGPLDFGDPKVLNAAEALYLQRVGNRLELQKLRQAEPRYGRALVERLAGAMPPAPEAAQTLARARAETVRATLLEHGVDPSRVRLEDPSQKQAAEEGVPTALSLSADLPQQNAQQAPSVREVQRKLNAAGFDAGPVDGIFGPKTRQALKDFQQASGLQPTGEVDEATLGVL